MISQALEVSLHMSFVEARQLRHEFITVEHLLLALLDNPSSAEVLRACRVDVPGLRQDLTTSIRDNTPTVGGLEEVNTQPTLGFQRVIQRAIMHVQSSGGGMKEVTGANVLVAIFGEKESHAVYFLQRRGVTRADVVNYVAHGVGKDESSEAATAEAPRGDSEGIDPVPTEEKPVAHPADDTIAVRMPAGSHLMLRNIRRWNTHRAFLRAETGCCIVLSINQLDDGLTLYTEEQVQALRAETELAKAAQAVHAIWKNDGGAEALKQAIEALGRVLDS